jgi:hypothetical protein
MNKFQSGKALLVAFGLTVVALAVPAGAQTIMRVNIPFEFVAGSQTLPAGPYSFVIDADFSHCHIDSMTDGSVRNVSFVPGKTRRSADTSGGLVQFQKYGNRYFLSALWKPGYTDGLAVVPSRRLVESAKAEGIGEAVGIASASR